jgi:hypothetical protein
MQKFHSRRVRLDSNLRLTLGCYFGCSVYVYMDKLIRFSTLLMYAPNERDELDLLALE